MSFLWSFGSKKEPAASTVAQTLQPSFKAMSNAFRKGVQYNMKIVLRGDVMTGKTNLFNRLQGLDFDENYISTPQIQVANIPWHYKDSNDIVKIEVWDVVDKAHNKTKSDNKDASTVNVYRNTHGAIFLFDTTKPWTFDYVNNELSNVPETMSVLVIGNFCDKEQERKVEFDTIHATLYEHNQDRIKKGAIKPNLIRYAETSMKSGLGLKYIYEYLGVPFLQLMIESLNKQLELKAVEIVDLLETLDKDDDVPESMQRRRGQDNFDQPRQQEDLKLAWDQELEDIALDHPTMLEQPTSFHRSDTPPPPTLPVKSKKKKDVKLVSEEIPAVVDHFNVGEELQDDWFGEDTNITTNLAAYKPNDSDDEGPRNPMVAADEDVEPIVEYYSKENNVLQIHPKDQDDEIEHEIKEEPVIVESYRPPAFKSELNDVWSRSLRRLSGPDIMSDSEDEDNRRPTPMDSPYLESPTFNFASGDGYEEIGGSNDNPWSTGQNNTSEKEVPVYDWETNQDQDQQDQNQQEVSPKQQSSPKQEELDVVVSPKKKKTGKKKTGKKKTPK
ncbi:hypothetical protein INT48_001911 [Thamnidium elegans]|uniref:Uncharacterized protein n=1 Tax=Thamnidium elegans TaxID=101142 RepID=A0A8H7SM22_9FUNG|nr:hypothetical protein INT48_001911 [Thamnidium elegans]